MPATFIAQAPGSHSTSSIGGDASGMLVRQYKFPFEYEKDENHWLADHDRVMSWHRAEAQAALAHYVGSGELAIGRYAEKAAGPELLAFCVAFLKADVAIEWTGCRVCVTVHRANGYPVYTIEIFAKRPGSATVEYSTPNAPNVDQIAGGDYWFRRPAW